MKKIIFVILFGLLLSMFSGCKSIRDDIPADSIDKQEEDKKEADKQKKDKQEEDKIIEDQKLIESLPIISHKNEEYQILAWNDLGMHYIDSDYSVFSISPPGNTLVTQLIKKNASATKLIDSDVNISYQAVSSFTGKYNTYSADKINFWQYASKLFNTTIEKDIGLKGNSVQKTTFSPLNYDNNYSWWSVEKIPTVPLDNNGELNEYPMVRVIAKDTNGEVLAETITVLPVSTLECKACHGSNSNYAPAKPFKGYVDDSDIEKDYRYNILRLHDQQHDIDSYLTALQEMGYSYQSSLEQTARDGIPILCAICHKSNALKTQGLSGIGSLSSSMHLKHSTAINPIDGKTLDKSAARGTCYACHSGHKTQWLRGVMGKAQNSDNESKIECQNCHGNMSAVGNPNRDTLVDLPNCQACHQDAKRYTNAVIDVKTGALREATDRRFATNLNDLQESIPYRFSVGHGNLKCAACHGSAHAIYDSQRKEDNIQSISAQGHAGTIAECTSCHKYMPTTIDGGPHGMHTIGIAWVDNEHQHAVIDHGSESCKACHGLDYNGTSLSTVFSPKRLSGKSFKKGHQISCYDCHNGPTGINY